MSSSESSDSETDVVHTQLDVDEEAEEQVDHDVTVAVDDIADFLAAQPTEYWPTTRGELKSFVGSFSKVPFELQLDDILPFLYLNEFIVAKDQKNDTYEFNIGAIERINLARAGAYISMFDSVVRSNVHFVAKEENEENNDNLVDNDDIEPNNADDEDEDNDDGAGVGLNRKPKSDDPIQEQSKKTTSPKQTKPAEEPASPKDHPHSHMSSDDPALRPLRAMIFKRILSWLRHNKDFIAKNASKVPQIAMTLRAISRIYIEIDDRSLIINSLEKSGVISFEPADEGTGEDSKADSAKSPNLKNRSKKSSKSSKSAQTNTFEPSDKDRVVWDTDELDVETPLSRRGRAHGLSSLFPSSPITIIMYIITFFLLFGSAILRTDVFSKLMSGDY